jgi:hypothetical protein
VVAALCLVIVAAPHGADAQPAETGSSGDPMHLPFLNSDGHLFEWHGELRELDDSTLAWHKGEPSGDGGCVFSVPELVLPEGASEVAQRQVATNYTTCEVLVETGTPTPESQPAELPPSEVSSESGRDLTGSAELDAGVLPDGVRSGGASASAYYRIWWEDVVNLWVTKTTRSIWWNYDFSKVTSSEGAWLYEWRSGSGWLKHSNSQWSSLTSARHKYYSDVTYKNGAFCWPGTVWNYYDNQYVQGTAGGARSGSYTNTWTTYPFACPTLHFHTQLGVA